jgi:hypothetical protein
MRKSNLTAAIDDLGRLLAEKAALELKIKAIKADLGELEDGAYEGDLFRVTVTHSTRDTLDMKAVRAKLSRQFIQANTTTSEVVTINCKARTGEELAA